MCSRHHALHSSLYVIKSAIPPLWQQVLPEQLTALPCCSVDLNIRCGSHHRLTGKQQQQQQFAEEVSGVALNATSDKSPLVCIVRASGSAEIG